VRTDKTEGAQSRVPGWLISLSTGTETHRLARKQKIHYSVYKTRSTSHATATSICSTCISSFCPISEKKSVITAILFKSLQDCPVCPSVKSGFEDTAESEHWWNYTNKGKRTYSEENTSQCYLAHHKSHTGWPGIESRPSRWETGDRPLSNTEMYLNCLPKHEHSDRCFSAVYTQPACSTAKCLLYVPPELKSSHSVNTVYASILQQAVVHSTYRI